VRTEEGYFLLSGIPMRELTRMPSGTVVFDPQVVLHIQPGAIGGYDASIIYDTANSSAQNNNYGKSNTLYIGRSATANSNYLVSRSLLFFELSGIPTTANIDSAKLRLYCFNGNSSIATTLDVHKMLVYWDEGVGDGTTGQASWVKRTPSNNWGANGGLAGTDYSSSYYARITKSGSDVNTWFEWDIKTLVSQWVATPSSNLGLMVKFTDDGTAQTSNRHFLMASSDYTTDATKRPILRVRYTFPDVTVYYVRDAAGNVIATYKIHDVDCIFL